MITNCIVTMKPPVFFCCIVKIVIKILEHSNHVRFIYLNAYLLSFDLVEIIENSLSGTEWSPLISFLKKFGFCVYFMQRYQCCNRKKVQRVYFKVYIL